MQPRNIILVFIIALALGGFYLLDEPAEPETKIEKERIEVSSLPENARYLINGDYYQLFDGSFERNTSQGSRKVKRLSVEGEPAYGDIDGDGDDDAFVVLLQETTGGERFHRAAFAVYREGEYRGTDTIGLGGEIDVLDTSINDGYAYLEFRPSAPPDQQATSTATRTRAFLLNTEENTIVEDALEEEAE